MAPRQPATLREACVHALAPCLHVMPLTTFTSVVWPEDCLLMLLDRVLALGHLNEHTAALFKAVARDNPRLAARLAALNLQPVPPLAASSSSRWLGQPSHLY